MEEDKSVAKVGLILQHGNRSLYQASERPVESRGTGVQSAQPLTGYNICSPAQKHGDWGFRGEHYAEPSVSHQTWNRGFQLTCSTSQNMQEKKKHMHRTLMPDKKNKNRWKRPPFPLPGFVSTAPILCFLGCLKKV